MPTQQAGKALRCPQARRLLLHKAGLWLGVLALRYLSKPVQQSWREGGTEQEKSLLLGMKDFHAQILRALPRHTPRNADVGVRNTCVFKFNREPT